MSEITGQTIFVDAEVAIRHLIEQGRIKNLNELSNYRIGFFGIPRKLKKCAQPFEDFFKIVLWCIGSVRMKTMGQRTLPKGVNWSR